MLESSVNYPVVVVDDDGWLELVQSADELTRLIEPGYPEETAMIFDDKGALYRVDWSKLNPPFLIHTDNTLRIEEGEVLLAVHLARLKIKKPPSTATSSFGKLFDVLAKIRRNEAYS